MTTDGVGAATPDGVDPIEGSAAGSTARLPAAAAGVVAGLAGLAAGELLATLTNPAAAPLTALAGAVADRVPAWLKEWAISAFGFADKAVLTGTITAVGLGLCAVAGLLARRSPAAGALVLAALGALLAWAGLTRPEADASWAVASVVTCVVGIAVLLWLRRRLPRAMGSADKTSNEPPAALLDLDTPQVRPASQPDRRDFLIGAGAIAGVSVAALAGSRFVTSTSAPGPSAAVPSSLPTADNPLAPLPAGLESRYPGITPWVTPNDAFYRIDTAFAVPRLSREDWSLTIDGEVDNPYTLTWNDLTQFEFIERDITLVCVSNTVGGSLAGSARWLGIRTSDLLRRAGVQAGADQVFSMDVSGMTISVPLQALLDDRDALLAVAMNGQPLPRDHGFPARLVTPGLFGFVGSTKWVTRLNVSRYSEKAAYWTTRGWVTDGEIWPQTRIDTPGDNSSVTAQTETHIGGVAWAQQRGIARVEVQIDDGPWQEATLGPDAGIDYWVQWYLPWTPAAGRHSISARATDGTGEVQTQQKRTPYPEGASGYHSITVEAAA